MDKKGGLVLSVIILAAVFVAGAIVGGPAASTLAQSPRSFSTAAIIANACNADEVCEVNRVLINDQADLRTSAHGGFSINVGEVDMATVFSAEPTGDVILGGDVRILGDLTLNGAYNVECKSFSSNGSAENTCLTNGYNYCLFSEYHKTTRYLDGVNGTCDGEIQVELVEPYVGVCASAGGGGGGGCGFNSEGVEPYYGSYSESLPGEINVLCCRTAGSSGGGDDGGSSSSGGGGGGSSGSSDEG